MTTNPRWPYPGETPVERARRVALAYRARLRALSVEACDDVDNTMADFGEDWMLPRGVTHDPFHAATTAEAAQLVGVPEQTIRYWATCAHPYRPGHPLLPRLGWRGRERTYAAELVLGAAAAVTRARRDRIALRPFDTPTESEREEDSTLGC